MVVVLVKFMTITTQQFVDLINGLSFIKINS
jgi:hypothetical protein